MNAEVLLETSLSSQGRIIFACTLSSPDYTGYVLVVVDVRPINTIIILLDNKFNKLKLVVFPS